MKQQQDVKQQQDAITFAVELAWKAHESGDLTADQLTDILKDAINCRAFENGYADKYGPPFPSRLPRKRRSRRPRTQRGRRP